MPDGHPDRHSQRQRERDREPSLSQLWCVGDHRRRARRAADRDGEGEVDQQGAERNEGPALAERLSDPFGPPPPLGKRPISWWYVAATTR